MRMVKDVALAMVMAGGVCGGGAVFELELEDGGEVHAFAGDIGESDGLFAVGMACSGDVGCGFAGELEAIVGKGGDGFLEGAVEGEGGVELVGFAGGDAQDDGLAGSGDEGFALEVDARDFVGCGGDGSVEIELAAIVLGWGGVGEFEAEVAEGLVGFGEEALHLVADLVG